MINFNKNSVFNLKQIDVSSVRGEVSSFLIEGEEILDAFKTIRDQVVFTNKRIISIDVQGITGKGNHFQHCHILPYNSLRFRPRDLSKSSRTQSSSFNMRTALPHSLNSRGTSTSAG